ncbi:hypothetical protein, partial [Escherichia coli]|uniref:hypothetical protein n=1 Tax=Escherichia coli TaxID=562 RepID=UPI001BDB8A9F
IPAWCGYYVSIHLHFIPEMFAMKSTFRLFNSCCSRFMSALDDASSSGCQYLLVEVIKTKMAAGCYPCGRFRAHIAITAA